MMTLRTVALFALFTCAALASCGDGRTPIVLSDAPPVDDMAEPSAECNLPSVRCGRVCANPRTDPNHCGGCDRPCGPGRVCAGGRCDVACPEGQFRCGDRCATLSTDRVNCGACGMVCAAGRVCSMGRCALACGPMYTACEPPTGVDAGVSRADAGDASIGLPTERYCTDTRTDEFNCGACGNACPPGNVCNAARCELSCTRGLTRCGSSCVDLTTSPANCGACGTMCMGAQRCVRGRCEGSQCVAGQMLCGAECANLRASSDHCGMCGNRCPAQTQCEAGACVPNCRRGFTVCGAVCADLLADARHCGRCGVMCPVGQTCMGGNCQLVCPLDRAPCGTACVDTSTDSRNCGGCGITCAAGIACRGGACAQGCSPTQTVCPGGLCADLRVDTRNCGACGLACLPGYACVAGLCAPTAGADAVACPGPSSLCGPDCVDTRSDNRHCGGCGRACAADRVCLSGMCVAPCAPGQSRCGGACVGVLSNPSNCGACGVVCPSGQSCSTGRCIAGALPTRYSATRDPIGDGGVTSAFIDACAAPGVTRILPMSDEGEARVPVPFAMRYFTNDIAAGSLVTISANGWIGMTGDLFGGRSVFIPSTSAPNGIVAVHAGDQETTAPICVATVGTAPRRQWVVEWFEVSERTSLAVIGGTSLTYEAIFTEDTGTIDLLYERVVGTPQSRYHGVESPAGTGVPGACLVATSYFCSQTTGARVRYTPAP